MVFTGPGALPSDQILWKLAARHNADLQSKELGLFRAQTEKPLARMLLTQLGFWAFLKLKCALFCQFDDILGNLIGPCGPLSLCRRENCG